MQTFYTFVSSAVRASLRKPIGTGWAFFMVLGGFAFVQMPDKDRSLFMLMWGLLSILVLIILTAVYE